MPLKQIDIQSMVQPKCQELANTVLIPYRVRRDMDAYIRTLDGWHWLAWP